MTSKQKKRLTAAIVALLLIGGIGGAYLVRTAMRERSLERAYREGMAAYARGDYMGAMAGLGAYVGRGHADAGAMLALADARRHVPQENNRHLIVALSIARAAALAAPSDPKPLEMMVDLCENLGFATETRETADKLLAMDAKHLGALLAKARALGSSGKYADGLRAAQAAAAAHPDSLPAHDAVIRLMQLGGKSPEEIVSYGAKAANDHAQSVAFALLECRAAAITKNQDAAITAARRAAGLPLKTDKELSELVRYLDALGCREEVEKALGGAVSNPALARVATVLKAERDWKFGRGQEIAQILAGLDDLGPQTPDREVALRAIVLDAAGDKSDAAIATLAARDSTESRYWAAVLRGRRALAKGDLKAATSELTAAANLDSAQGFAQYFLGETLSRTGDWRGAAQQLQAVGQSDPMWRIARIASASLLLQNGADEQARQQALAAFAQTKLWPELLLYATASVAVLESGRATEETAATVLRELDNMQKDQPKNATIAALRARALLAMGRNDEAVQATEALLALETKPPLESVLRLAEGLRRRGLAVAERLQQTATAPSPDGADAAGIRASELAAAGRTAEAEAMLQDAAARVPEADRPRLLLLRATILDHARDPRAAELLGSLAAAYPDNLSIQLAVLNSASAWADKELVAATLARAKGVLGEGASAVRLFECRRLLAFDRTEANASRVVSLLASSVHNDPGYLDAAMLLADAYVLLQDTGHAAEVLARAVDADPTQPAAYPHLIALLQRTGHPAEASQRLAVFRTIRGLSLPSQRARAELLKSLGLRAQYTQELQDLAARGTSDDRLAYALERAAAGDTTTAGKLFEGLLAEPTPSARAIAAAAEFVAARDGLDRGLEILARLPAGTTESEAKRLRADLLTKHHRFDDAERILRERTADNSAGAWADLAQFYLDRGRADDAAPAVAKGLAVAPQDPRLLWLGGAAKLRSGKDTTAALSDLINAAELDNLIPEVREMLAAFQEFGRSADQAQLIGALVGVTKKHPTSLQAWRQLINVYRLAGQTEQAADAGASAAQFLPSDPRAVQLAAEALTDAGRTTEALAMARRWRELQPDDTLGPDLVLARLACMKSQFDDAIRILTPLKARIIENADARPDAVELFAAALAAAGRADQADELFAGRSLATGQWGLAYCRVGSAMASHPEQARAWMARLELSDSAEGELLLTAAQAWYTLGLSSRDQADLGRAVGYARRGADNPAFRGVASALLGEVYEALDDPTRAIAAYRIAVEQMPQNPTVANNLAYLLASRSESGGEAAALAKRAVDLAVQQRLPDTVRANFLETLGIAYLRTGAQKEAKDAFQAGLTIDPIGLDLTVGLAEAQAALGDWDNVRQTLDRIQMLTERGQPLSPQLKARVAAVRQSLPSSR